MGKRAENRMNAKYCRDYYYRNRETILAKKQRRRDLVKMRFAERMSEIRSSLAYQWDFKSADQTVEVS